MNARDFSPRLLGRKMLLRTSIAPFAATIIGLCTLAGAQAGTGSQFYDYLEQGYREIAGYASARAGDQNQSNHFAGKAQLASAEQAVAPDMPTTAALPQDVRAEMMAARNRLADALAAGAQEIDPLTTAIAQVNLDCWMAQFKGGAESGSADCRRLFYVAIAKLPSTVPQIPDDAVTTDGAQLAATGGASISAVGGTPPSGTAPGPVGGAIAAVGGPLQNLGAITDGAVASVTGSADSTLGSDTVSDTSGNALGGASDTAGGGVGQAGGAAGGALGAVGGAAGGALGAAGGAAGGVVGGAGLGGGGLGGALGGALGGLGGALGGGGGGLGGGGGGFGGGNNN